jgi:hypothetical protein
VHPAGSGRGGPVVDDTDDLIDDERAFVERLYDEALAEGPDFIN